MSNSDRRHHEIHCPPQYTSFYQREPGRELPLELARDGAQVLVCARTETSTDELPGSIGETVATIEADGGKAEGLMLDVTDDANVDAVIEQAWNGYGRIDILVNNAGILGGGGPFLEGDPELLDRFYRTNLRAPYVIAQRVGARMAQQGSGVIFNISSGLARLPDPSRGPGGGRGPGAVYGATKAALDRFAACAALKRYWMHSVSGKMRWGVPAGM